MSNDRGAPKRGFTLIELMVVLAVVALLLSIVSPRYFHSIQRAEEAVLRENLWLVRDAIDKHYADTGGYPRSLEELVARRYLRAVPADPITGTSATWVLIPSVPGEGSDVFDLRSGAPGADRSGVPYAQW